MAPAGKVTGFHKEVNDWYCDSGLPSDITVIVDGTSFHLHKFPLVSRCGKMDRICEESQEKFVTTELQEFPGSPEIFLMAVKFCYGMRVELSPRNIVMVSCVADYLEMTEDYGEDNLVSKAASFLKQNVLTNWKDSILALQSTEAVTARAEKLQIISKCLNALSMMICTNPSLFGLPMMMHGSTQSPGGSILWNGITTGAKIHGKKSDWWFEDISYLNVSLFERLIKTVQTRGIQHENISAAIIYYAKKHLPGLDRWSGKGSKTRTLTSFSLTPAAVDQRILLETIVNILPSRKGKPFCRFLLGLVRLALILGSSQTCLDSLEKRIGMQLEMATLDCLLIPSYSDSDTLYSIDCVERIVHYFILDNETSMPSTESLRNVAKLVDDYTAEVASDVNLKPNKIRSLAEALPESSRQLHDGLYRALDIYFKAHPWLSEKEKEELCNILDYQKLSIDACTHASQNVRLPLRVILQVLFFEQMQLRAALAGCLSVVGAETAHTATSSAEMSGNMMQRDGWVTVVRENQVLKVDMDNMRARVGELEEEFTKIKQEVKKVSKSHSSLTSPRLIARKIGCKFLQQSSAKQEDVLHSTELTPRASVEQGRHSAQRSKLIPKSSGTQEDVANNMELTHRNSVEQARHSYQKSTHRRSFTLF